MKEGEREISR